MIFISSSIEKFHKLKNYFAITKEWQLFMASNIEEVTSILFSTSADSLLIDLENPVSDLEKTIITLSEQFSYLHRIALRGDKFSARQRFLIENSHSSFKSPKSLSEMRLFLNRIDTFFPVVSKYDNSIRETESTKLENRVKDLYYLSNQEKPTLNDIIEIVVSSRKISEVILKRINSSFYGLDSTVSIPARAVRLLGVNGIKEVLEDNFPNLCQDLELKVA
jgi:hypothetical protein